MATNAIDVGRYLLQGDESEQEMLKALGLNLPSATTQATPVKPDLEEALLNHYNRTAPQGATPLGANELPEPIQQNLPPSTIRERRIPTPFGALDVSGIKAPDISGYLNSFFQPSAPAAPTAPQAYTSKRDLPRTPITETTAPTIPSTQTPPVIPAIPRAEIAPTPSVDQPSGLYNTLQKHASFVRDVLEGGGTLISDLATGGFGAALKVSDVLNATVARFASGKPFTGQPESPTFYRDLLKKSDSIVSNITYDPKSDIAKNVRGATGKVFEVFHDIAALPAKALTAGGIIDEDTAAVVGFATELYLFYKLDRGVRDAAPELRSKIANLKEKFSKGDATEARTAAEDLADAASKNPNLDGAMNEARGKFRDEGDAAAGAGRGPVGPTPGGPTPSGMYYDPADIAAYTSRIQNFADQFKRDNPNASVRDLRDALDNIPKPEPKPMPQPEQAARQSTYTTEAPSAPAEPTRPMPEATIPPGEMVVRPTVETTAPPATPVRDPLAEARAVASPPTQRTTVDDVISGRATPTSDLRTRSPESMTAEIQSMVERVGSSADEAVLTINSQISRGINATEAARVLSGRIGIPTEQANRIAEFVQEIRERGTLGRLVDQAPITPSEVAAAIPPEVAPAPTLGDASVAAAAPIIQATSTSPVPTSIETPVPAVVTPEVTRPATPTEVAPEIRELVESGKLAELKALAREAAGKQPFYVGLRRLGFMPEEMSVLEPQLKKVRAAKAPAKPAVQTVATEAALESMPAGTEVEIPAPAEPVVDTSPAIEKPKRKRRVVKAESPVTATNVVAEIAADAGVTAPARSVSDVRYYAPANMDDLGARARIGLEEGSPLESATPARLPVQLRFPASQLQSSGFGNAAQGAKPDAIFVDTAGMNTTTKLADIEAQVTRGRMSTEVADALRANLQRQANLTGLPLTDAHTFTGQQLMREATRIAAETGIDLYVKKGKNYELVPKDVVRTDAKLNTGDDLKPTVISNDAAGAYVESKTSDIGPETVRMIREAVEMGIDITDTLPPELIPHYKDMLERDRAGIDTSERRSPEDIAIDVETITEEFNDIKGAKGPRLRGVGRGGRSPLSNEGGFIDISAISDAARMAAQRLQADMRKLGKGVKEFLFGARPEDVAIFEKYLERINNPAPPDSTNPANMRFDPTNSIPGDRIVKQRVVSKKLNLKAPPLWQSEVTALQNAKDIKPGGSVTSLQLPYWQHRKADTQFIYYAYRTAQKNVDAARNDLHADMQELSRGFSTKSLENIGANGYQRQGPDGQRILTYNKVTPMPLSPAEKRLQANIDGIYADFWVRINEERIATGREALPAIDNYQTFARTQSLLNHLNMGSNLITDSVADIMAKYAKYKSTNFPYTALRKGAVYSAEMNALKILDTYAQSALKEIHLGPFIGKLHELIEQKLPDPVTGAETWLLKEEKPGLYTELRRWNDYLATGSNFDVPEVARYWLNIANRNLGYAMLSFGLRSGAVQISTLRNTYQSLGAPATVNGAFSHLMDIVSGGKQWDFALKNSHVLNSRKFVDAYNSAASAVIGRNPRDFMRAVSRGQIGEIQQLIGGLGMKFMEIPDMQAALMSWNAGYKHATKKLGYNHKDAVRFSDDLVVRTQGSTMPGDLAGVQRNAIGKALTQFQTFAISDWNFLTNEVFGKQQGISTRQMIVNIMRFTFATQTINELYRMLHIQTPFPELVRDFKKGVLSGLSNLIEPIPILSSTRYGRGIGGPLIETGRDLTRAIRSDPMAPNWKEPAAALAGVPGTRQASKYLRAQKRGETAYDSLMGWYEQEGPRRETLGIREHSRRTR